MKLYDMAANSAYDLYETFLKGLVGEFAVALDAADPSTIAVRSKFARNADKLLKRFASDVENLTTEIAVDAANLGIEHSKVGATVETRAQIADALYEIQSEAKANLIGAAAGDVQRAVKELSRVAYTIELDAMAGNSRSSAIIRARIGRVTGLRRAFVRADRAGKTWNTQIYAKTVVRSLAALSYADAMVFATAAAGKTKVRVRNQPNHRHDGMIVSIFREDSNTSYLDLREEIFHPNTNSWLEAF